MLPGLREARVIIHTVIPVGGWARPGVQGAFPGGSCLDRQGVGKEGPEERGSGRTRGSGWRWAAPQQCCPFLEDLGLQLSRRF